MARNVYANWWRIDGEAWYGGKYVSCSYQKPLGVLLKLQQNQNLINQFCCWAHFQVIISTFYFTDKDKEIQIILRLFLVIAMYYQASSINHSTSHVASWLGRKPRYMR
jgi:hypothetical protein